jgi:hypothetical protein
MFRHYDPSKYDPTPAFELPPEGEYWLCVEDAEEKRSKAGNEMIEVKLSVDGYACHIFHAFVDNEYIQKYLDRFFASFGITPGDFNLSGWIGRKGKARIKHEEYNGRTNAKIGYFIQRKDEQDNKDNDDFPLDMSEFGDDSGKYDTHTGLPF